MINPNERKVKISRRDFLRLSGVTTLCACVGTLGVSACADSSNTAPAPLIPESSYRREYQQLAISLSSVSTLSTIGGAARVVLCETEEDELKLLILRTSADTYRVFADRCTHNGRELVYIPVESRMMCRSRKSYFDLDGKIIQGPAERALSIYPSQIIGGELIIELDTNID